MKRSKGRRRGGPEREGIETSRASVGRIPTPRSSPVPCSRVDVAERQPLQRFCPRVLETHLHQLTFQWRRVIAFADPENLSRRETLRRARKYWRHGKRVARKQVEALNLAFRMRFLSRDFRRIFKNSILWPLKQFTNIGRCFYKS